MAFASFVASGQTCVSGTRILVHSTIYEEFIDKFLAKVEFIRNGMGDRMCFPRLINEQLGTDYHLLASNPASTMGTVISSKHLDRIDAMVKRVPTTAKFLTGGERLGQSVSALDEFDFSKGSFYPPTVITGVSIEDEIWQEEVFGPVVVVKTFEVSESCHMLAKLPQ